MTALGDTLFAVILLTIESAAIWGTVVGAKWLIDLL
jgi:hypothetical protein